MAQVVKDLAVKVGSYRDRNGQDRNRYQRVGRVVRMDDGGEMMLLDRWFNPAGVPTERDSIILYAFDVQERDGAQGGAGRGGATRNAPAGAPAPAPAARTPAGQGVDTFDDDIPF